MRIKQLVLNGFKSFPDKTTITFDPTINAVVGPNGCGKSNVLDSLRWVMGESSFTQMRCAKTEDLIFSGNRTHPPDNFTEVALILDNSEESAANNQLLYNLGTEIEVKRRFFRSGESEFYINRKPCKLKDIQDLFTSGGGSGHGYSIFDLPKMRQIISSNLKELFIEAAGLAFYTERKEEIERKLKLTADDLLRLNDIITERIRITRSLKRQAYRLMAFEKVKGEERNLQISLLKFDYKKICEDEKIALEELEKLKNQAQDLERKIADADNRRADLRKVLQEKENIRNVLQKEIDTIKEQVIVSEERLKANLDKQKYLTDEQNKLQAEFGFVEQIDASKQNLDEKQQYFNQIKSLYTAKEQEFEDLRRKNKDLEQEIFSDQLSLEELAEKDKHLFIRFSQLSTEISGIETKLQDNKRYLETLRDSQQALTAAKTESTTVKEYRSVLTQNLGKNFVGFLKELIIPKPGYECILESVLYGIHDAIIVNSTSEITLDNIPKDRFWTIISQLTKSTSPIPADATIAVGMPLRETVKFETTIPDYIKSIIDSFIIVDDYSEIHDAHLKYPEYSFVTKSGIVFTNSGILVIPRESSTTSKSGFDEKIRAISNEIEIFHSKSIELERKLISLQQEKQEKDIEKQELSILVKQKQEEINNKRNQNKTNLELASNLLFDLNKQREEITQIKSELDYITSEINRTESHRDTIFTDRNRLTDTISELVNEENTLRSNISVLQNKFAEKRTAFGETEVGMLSKEYDDLENQVNEYRVHLDIQNKNMTDKQLHNFEITKNRENIENQARELLPNGLEILKTDTAEIKNIDEIKKELSSVQRKIVAIGLINPLAKDDYGREKTELDKLTNQRSDIMTAQNNLGSALNEVTKKAEEMFVETYKMVQISFRRIFKDIFVEGDADIILENPGNPLDSEIKIIAQPKGKVPKRLDQLSDGEKALLALSLLFAFYDIKPAPFCFMDEVDAPLDDANVKRFTQFLKHISQTTQVIMITHNKLTIEASSVVIGVTTEEPGISKIVTVRFKDIPAFVKN